MSTTRSDAKKVYVNETERGPEVVWDWGINGHRVPCTPHDLDLLAPAVAPGLPELITWLSQEMKAGNIVLSGSGWDAFDKLRRFDASEQPASAMACGECPVREDGVHTNPLCTWFRWSPS